MNTMTTEKANEIILAHARTFLKKNYSYCEGENGVYDIEAYTDYQDCLSDDTIKKAFEKDTIEKVGDWLCEYMCEIFQDYEIECEGHVVDEIVKYIKEVETVEMLEAIKEQLDEANTLIVENELFYTNVNHQDVLKRSTIDLVISLENKTSQNYEFSLNNFDCDFEVWLENTEESINDGEIEEEDISLITLLKTQGYTFEQFKEYALDEAQTENKFLNSLINECENTMSSLNSLVFTVQANLNDYLEGKFDVRILPKNTVCGYVDFIHGGGSIMGIELEKDIDLSNVEILTFVDGARYRYGVKEIYGQFI